MAIDYSNFGGVTDTGSAPYSSLANLANAQSGQAWDIGTMAAKYADPFSAERPKYQKMLSDLMTNPGAQESSPYFKYLMETQMNQVNASNAAGGFRNSGRGLMALQDRAAGVASQAYFPQVQALSNLAMSGSSPAAAGVSFSSGANRSQDLAQMGAAAKAFQPQQSQPMSSWPTVGGSTASYGGGSGSALPSGGYTTTPSSSYGMNYNDFLPGGSSYSPGAGTGYVSSDYGTTNFNGSQPSTYDPYSYMSSGSQPSVYDAGFQYDPYSAVGLTAPAGYSGSYSGGNDQYASTDWGSDWGDDWGWE